MSPGLVLPRRGVIVKPTVSAFDPSSISGLQGWWKADAITGLVDGDPVPSWSDSSSNTRTLSQGTSAARPTYKTNVRNGLPAVRFDGVDDCVTRADAAGIASPPFIMFAVLSQSAGTAYKGAAIKVGNGATGVAMGLGTDSNFSAAGNKILALSDAVAWLNPNLAFAALAKHVTSLQVTGGNAWEMRRDGVLGSGSGSVVPNAATAAFSLGGYSDGGGRFYGGDLCEVLIYNVALSTGNRQAVESYLKAKWGTP